MPAKTYVQTIINGEHVDFLCEPRQSLLEVLRDVIGLTGTKEGCNDGNCGACTVELDGRIVTSCLVLGVEVEGKEITTIEGVARGSTLHPVQQAFLENAALQCGICTPASSSQPSRCSSTTLTRPSMKSASGSPTTSAGAPAMTRSYGPSRTRR